MACVRCNSAREFLSLPGPVVLSADADGAITNLLEHTDDASKTCVGNFVGANNCVRS